MTTNIALCFQKGAAACTHFNNQNGLIIKFASGLSNFTIKNYLIILKLYINIGLRKILNLLNLCNNIIHAVM